MTLQLIKKAGVLVVITWRWLAFSFLFFANAVMAEQTLIVGNDSGGSLLERTETIAAYRSNDTRVEIRFGYCLSACTLFLGLEKTCVNRRVKFGFHGPSSNTYGVALPKEEFEYWSHLMGAHYPPEVRKWFLSESRHRIVGFAFLDGADLIRHGVAECGANKQT